MNILSSLLNWIGNTIGADPNTLTTTDKTLVGAINEVDAAINELDAAINELDAKSLKSVHKTVLGQSTATLSFTNGSRCVIFCMGSGSAPMGLFLAGSSSVGVVYIKEVSALGSGYACKADGNNKIKFTTATAQMRVMVIASVGTFSFD